MSREKILFRQDGWLLVRSSTITQNDRNRCFVYSDAEHFIFESVIKHHCPYDGTGDEREDGPRDVRNVSDHKGMSFLDEEDSFMGICWWCMTAVPSDLNALFKLQNWESLLKVHISETWNADEVAGRKDEIRNIKKDIKNGEWDGYNSRATWRRNNADSI